MARNARNVVLQEIREAAGHTQTVMGKRIGRAQSIISDVEGGRKRCSARLALDIADAYRPTLYRLGITVEDILRGERKLNGNAA